MQGTKLLFICHLKSQGFALALTATQLGKVKQAQKNRLPSTREKEGSVSTSVTPDQGYSVEHFPFMKIY